MTAIFRKRSGSLGKLLELLIYPSSCRLCEKLLEKPGERVVCLACLDNLRAENGPSCLCCGRFFEDTGEPHYCLGCLTRRPAYSLHRSCGRYDGELRELILLFKYKGFKVLGKALADYALRSVGEAEELWTDLDLVVPVPLHPKRRRERGFNQSEVLGMRIAERLGVEVMANCLKKTINVPPQTSLEADERERNVRGAFRSNKEALVRDKVVLLVDDVFTTGATIRECSRILRKAGAQEVRGFTLAQA